MGLGIKPAEWPNRRYAAVAAVVVAGVFPGIRCNT